MNSGSALLETSCVYSEIMFTMISFFQKLIKGGGGWNKSGGLESFQKLISEGGDNYSVLESTVCM